MTDKLIADIQEIQNNIEKEKDNELTCLIMSLADTLDSDDNSDEKKENRDFDLVILSWLCLKIDLECQAFRQGLDVEDSLREDIDDVFDYVKRREYEWELSRSVISDAIDLLLSIGTVKESELQKFGSRYITKTMREQNDISNDMYHLFKAVAKQYMLVGKEELAYHLIEQLCILSRTRNKPAKHKQLVVYAISDIFDQASSTICRIASIDAFCFNNECSEYASDFYWFYACSLWREGNASAAGIFFSQCYSIRQRIYGEKHWLTALAKRNEAIIDYNDRRDSVSRDILREFVQEVESNRYADMNQYEAVQAETIFALLTGEFKTVSRLPEYNELIDLLEHLCNEYPEIETETISMRVVWNFRGNYYLQKGEYILAENAFQNALKEKGNIHVKSNLSDDQIRTNLLAIANVQNDIATTIDVLAEMSDNDELSFADILRGYISIIGNYMQAGIEIDQEEIREIMELVHDLCDSVINQDDFLEDSHEVAAMFIYAATVYFLQNYIVDVDEQTLILEALNKIEKDVLTYQLTHAQKLMVIQAEGLLAWNLGLPDAEKYIKKSLNSLSSAGSPLIIKVSINHTASLYFAKKGNISNAIQCADKMMSYMTDIWHSYVKYANDTRLVNIIFPLQIQFSSCYAMIRRFSDINTAYERILQFKALASLAGRERNRLSHTLGMDLGILKEINALQDKIAVLETRGIFQESFEEQAELEVELRKLESEYAMKFPVATQFTEISWSRVENAIPDNSVVLEYYLALDDFGQMQFESHSNAEELEVFELYFIKKHKGKTNIKRFVIKDAVEILEKAGQFISIYQEKSVNAGISDRDELLEDLRYDLYEALLLPVINELGDSTTIYFAPDSSLVNLPFELLYEDERLEEYYQIVKIECARDFLFSSLYTDPTKKGLVIGNPDYSAKEREITMDDQRSSGVTRAIDIDLSQIDQLPFAEIEANRVADYLSTFPWIGRSATKEKLLTAEGYQNLHIATHGFFDISGETDAIYSSCLIFAGVKNWMQELTTSKTFGNGIVTADEISRMNLSSTRLVVLSSCLNGRSDMIISKGFQGMVGAFAAAGVKYVIAHLWNAPESIGTVILMDAFYYCYTEEKMEPPLALAKAKEYLRTLTIENMREHGWFEFARKQDLDFTSKRSLAMMEKADSRLRPFKDEIFWGGFSCYRCN